MIALVTVVLGASVGPVVFKAPGGFVVTSRTGEVLDTVRTIGGKTPESLAVSPDGKIWVFTAHEESANQPLLYRASKGAAPALLGQPEGYHAQPRFTNDGKWIYFIHHSNPAAGAAGTHGSGLFGQVWRIRPDGTGLTQVTSSDGCKTSPDAESEARVYMTHADCNKRSSIDLVISAKPATLISPLSTFRQSLPRIAPKGRKLAFVRLANDAFSLVLMSGGRESVVQTWQTPSQPSELEWAADGETLLMQMGSTVELVEKDGAVRDLLDLSGVLP